MKKTIKLHHKEYKITSAYLVVSIATLALVVLDVCLSIFKLLP